jgi:hypothetical protein
MAGAFLYLTACTLKNRIRRRLRRLREPRYILGLIVGVLYMWFAVFRNMGHRARSRPDAAFAGTAALAAFAGPIEFVGSLLLLATAAIAWVWPGAGQPLRFSRAEVQFLFPAPVTRRQLVHYEVLRSQLGILFGSAIATLFLRSGSLRGSWIMLVGLWVLLMVVRLHLTGVALRRTSLVQHGTSGFARQWFPPTVVVGAISVLAAALIGHWSSLASMASGGEVFRELQRLGSTGAAGAVLWPFRALARLPLAPPGSEFWRALPPALAILALNYVWVLRSDAAFEEASAAQAEKRAVARPAARAAVKGAAATPFTLAAAGPPETAILWKNLILVGRYISLRTLLRLLPIILAFAIVAHGSGAKGIASAVAAMCLPLAAFVALMGSQMMRNDLRQDLANLALLKTWPVRGAALIRGEVLGPTVVVTAVAWLLLLTGAMLGGGLRTGSPETSAFAAHRFSYLAAAAVLAPALILSQTVVQNGLAVLFPAWITVGASRSRGIDAMGQRLLMLAAILLTLLASVLPGTILAVAFAGLVYWLTGTVLIVAPAVIVAAVVAGECWLATEGLGRVFDRTDLTAMEAVE